MVGWISNKFGWANLLNFFVYLFTTWKYIFWNPYNCIRTIKKFIGPIFFYVDKKRTLWTQQPNNVNIGFGIIVKYNIPFHLGLIFKVNKNN
jgi:hypothetical protein